MKRRFILFAFIALVASIFFTLPVKAETAVAKEEIVNNSTGEIGRLIIYKDNKVKITYKYSAYDVNIELCDEISCYTPFSESLQDSYSGDDYPVFDLKPYLVPSTETKKTYNVSISAKFSASAYTTTITIPGTIEAEINIAKDGQTSITGEAEYDESVEKLLNVVNKIVIPLLYATFLIVIIVKGIMLAIDISHNADAPEIRKEKIHAFVWIAIAMLVASIITTIGAFFTGMFNGLM